MGLRQRFQCGVIGPDMGLRQCGDGWSWHGPSSEVPVWRWLVLTWAFVRGSSVVWLVLTCAFVGGSSVVMVGPDMGLRQRFQCGVIGPDMGLRQCGDGWSWHGPSSEVPVWRWLVLTWAFVRGSSVVWLVLTCAFVRGYSVVMVGPDMGLRQRFQCGDCWSWHGPSSEVPVWCDWSWNGPLSEVPVWWLLVLTCAFVRGSSVGMVGPDIGLCQRFQCGDGWSQNWPSSVSSVVMVGPDIGLCQRFQCTGSPRFFDLTLINSLVFLCALVKFLSKGALWRERHSIWLKALMAEATASLFRGEVLRVTAFDREHCCTRVGWIRVYKKKQKN